MIKFLNVILFFFIFIGQVVGSSLVYAEVVQCIDLVAGTPRPLADLTSEKFAPKSTLVELKVLGLNREQTVFTVDRTRTHVILRKAHGQPWFSRKSHVPDANTPHGDPRSLVLVAGTKIGKFLGFKLIENQDSVELHVPQLHFLKTKIDVLNEKLVRAGLEPIIFNLVKMGLATDRQIVSVSKQKNGRSEFQFPFDDVDPMLLIHEYSYHLIPLLVPNHILRRASLVSEWLMEFVKIIEKVPGLKPAADAIIKERTLQLDLGTGLISLTLWGLKYAYPNLSYREIARQLSEQQNSIELAAFQQILGFFTQSATTPARAAVFSAIINTGINDFELHVKENERFQLGNMYAIFEDGFGVRLNSSGRASLQQAISSFLKKHEAESIGFDAKQSDQDLTDPINFLNAIDQRIQDIERVI